VRGAEYTWANSLRLQAALAGLQREGLVELGWVDGQTSGELDDAMARGPWHAFHFVGHGIGADDVSGLLAEHHPLRLVVLTGHDPGDQDGPYDTRRRGDVVADEHSQRRARAAARALGRRRLPLAAGPRPALERRCHAAGRGAGVRGWAASAPGGRATRALRRSPGARWGCRGADVAGLPDRLPLQAHRVDR